VVLAAGLVSPITGLLKDYFGRIRPAFDDGGARLDSLSHPSGLGVHFLSDVVGGWALGLGWTLLTAVLLGVLPGKRGVLR
jgi:undecaprenyl-diphosphatase